MIGRCGGDRVMKILLYFFFYVDRFVIVCALCTTTTTTKKQTPTDSMSLGSECHHSNACAGACCNIAIYSVCRACTNAQCMCVVCFLRRPIVLAPRRGLKPNTLLLLVLYFFFFLFCLCKCASAARQYVCFLCAMFDA